MVYAPTGSGKTGLAAFIAAGLVSRGMRVLFVAPYTILINQTAQRFTEYGCRDLPTVAFCVNKAHANFVTMQFNKAGINAEVMVAETPHEERQAMIHRFER